MKKALLIPFLLGSLLIFSGSCKKNQTSESYSKAIVGAWALQYTVGGYRLAGPEMPEDQQLIFFSTGDYKVFSKGKAVDSGQYTLIKDNGVREATCQPSLNARQFEKLTYIRATYNNDMYVKISGNELETYSGCLAADGSYARYERLTGVQ